MTWSSSSRRPPRGRRRWAAVHALEPAQTGRLPGRQHHPCGADRPGAAAADPARPPISFQRTRTWKESADPDKDAKLDRIEHVTSKFPDRCFAFDQFGPLSIRPAHGSTWARQKKPRRLPATYHRTHGIRYFHGCYSLGDDQLWGITRLRKGGDHTLAALKSIRAARPDGAPVYVILDNLSANKTPPIRSWAKKHKAELCFTPTSASWANPIEAQFGRYGHSPWRLGPPEPHRAGPPPAGVPGLAQRERPPP